MRVVLLHNPSSGRGQAGRVIDAVVNRLSSAEWDVDSIAVGPGTDSRTLEKAIAGSNVVVIVGGDGTIHYTLPSAVAAGVPIYQLPFGTENLFAREFGMDQSAERLERAIRAYHVAKVDTAMCNGRPFVLMCSVGFDANIVERVAGARNGPISKLDYVGHGLREMLAPRIPTLTISVDGEQLVATQPGMVVVANSRQYAARLDPAPEARMNDGLLDVVFFPGSSRVELGLWGVRTMLRTHVKAPDLVMGKGRRVMIRAESPSPFQLDGEHAGHIHPMTTDHRVLELSINPLALSVLLPEPIGTERSVPGGGSSVSSVNGVSGRPLAIVPVVPAPSGVVPASNEASTVP